MSDTVHVTKEGLEQLRAEYDELVNVRRPAIIKAVAEAREEGDLRENAGYHAARHDQSMIEGRIRQLEQMLKNVEIIESAEARTDIVGLGSTVTIDIEGDQETYTIVGPVEAKPAEGRISNESPFGVALMGARVGQTVNIQTPATTLKARVLSIE